MNATKKWVGGTLASVLAMAVTCHAWADITSCDCASVSQAVQENQQQPFGETLVVNEPQAPVGEVVVIPTEEPAVAAEQATHSELSDKLHQVAGELESSAAVHYYSFTSVRGQDVLLGTPFPATLNKNWKVEYQEDGADWQLKKYNNPVALRGLKPMSVINVRVSVVEGSTARGVEYKLVFGSYPHMRYDLHNQEGFIPIPYGFAEPAFLATQAVDNALLEATFWDSKGAPLEGGVLSLSLIHRGPGNPISISITSGSSGKASELVSFPKCEGGWSARSFTHKQEVGVNTWATRYSVGKYSAHNTLLEGLADKAHTFDFGHICKRYLINWSRH